jgi:hypothetical protein
MPELAPVTTAVGIFAAGVFAVDIVKTTVRENRNVAAR